MEQREFFAVGRLNAKNLYVEVNGIGDYSLAQFIDDGPRYLKTQRGDIRSFSSLDTIYRLCVAERIYAFSLSLGPGATDLDFGLELTT